MKIFDIISLKKSDRAKLRSLNDIIDILFLQKDIKKLSIIDINNLNIEGVEKYQSLIMKHLYDIFNPDIACFYKRNINENVFEKFIGFPDTFWQKKENKEKFEKWPINKGAIGKVVKTCKPVIINNPGVLIKKGEFVPFQKKMKSEILVPIVINDFVVSIIILSYFKKNKIDIVLREYINTVCSVLGIIFKNEYDKKNKERIIDFLKSVSSHSSENIDKILKNYYDSMKSLMKIHIIEYYLYNKIDDTLVLRGYYPLKVKNKKVSSDDFDLKVFLYKDSLSGEAIYQKKAIIHTNIINDSKFNNKKFAKRFKLNWFISVPILVSSQEVIGVINIWPDMPYELYDFALSEYIELSTYSLGTFIKESYVLETESFLFSYDSIFKNLIELGNVKEAWDNLAIIVSQQMKCEACSIFIKDINENLRLQGTTGIEGNPNYEDVVYKKYEGLTGKAFMQKEPLLYYIDLKQKHGNEHISKYREILKTPGKSKSIIFIQIFDQNDNVIGLIRCNNKIEGPNIQTERFTFVDIYKLKSIARFISNLYLKASWLQERQKNIERSFNSLHHEVLSPVDGILSHSEWLDFHILRSNRRPEDWDLVKISKKIDDMKQTVKLIDMLVTTMGKLDEDIVLQPKLTSISNLLYTCRSYIFNEALRKQVVIKIEHLGIPKINIDYFQIMRVFYNILRNCIKYSDKKESEKYVKITGSDLTNKVIIKIEDNGIGIVPGEEEIIFNKLKRGSNATKVFPEGTGLGLAYAKKIIKYHNGLIYFDKLYKPTILIIELPKNLEGTNK